MARTNRRIYANRRKRSPNKFSAAARMFNASPGIQETDSIPQEFRNQTNPIATSWGVKTKTPPYLSGGLGIGAGSGEKMGGGKTYTITEA